MPPRVELRRSNRGPVRGRGASRVEAETSVGRGDAGRGRGRPRDRGTRGRARRARGRGRGEEPSVDQPGPQEEVQFPEESEYEDFGEAVGVTQAPVPDPAVALREAEIQTRLLDSFLKKGPPEFRSAATPEVAIEFLEALENKFELMGLGDELKVKFAVYQLSGGARSWWNHVHKDLVARGEMSITWGERTVDGYEERFSDLCRLIPGVYPTELQRIAGFRQGLRLQIRERLSLFTYTSFHQLRNAALQVERDIAESRGEKRGRSDVTGATGPYRQGFQRNFQQHRPGRVISVHRLFDPDFQGLSQRLAAATSVSTQFGRGGSQGNRGGRFGGRQSQGRGFGGRSTGVACSSMSGVGTGRGQINAVT
ncbi:hypothetical protein LIER_27372 [Lithospermum erythrorhizon]|uniref:Retrotransposon gag domain-containing protein n=1 Tax=Lithospermum erythrorhizon TaxID=34254 RepID=A0AAV3RF52_LITER